jgi:hypothetical protein
MHPDGTTDPTTAAPSRSISKRLEDIRQLFQDEAFPLPRHVSYVDEPADRWRRYASTLASILHGSNVQYPGFGHGVIRVRQEQGKRWLSRPCIVWTPDQRIKPW